MTPSEVINNHLTCHCDEWYKSKGKTDPNCVRCEYGPEIEMMMEEYAAQFKKDNFPFGTIDAMKDLEGKPLEVLNQTFERLISKDKTRFE